MSPVKWYSIITSSTIGGMKVVGSSIIHDVPNEARMGAGGVLAFRADITRNKYVTRNHYGVCGVCVCVGGGGGASEVV